MESFRAEPAVLVLWMPCKGPPHSPQRNRPVSSQGPPRTGVVSALLRANRSCTAANVAGPTRAGWALGTSTTSPASLASAASRRRPLRRRRLAQAGGVVADGIAPQPGVAPRVPLVPDGAAEVSPVRQDGAQGGPAPRQRPGR